MKFYRQLSSKFEPVQIKLMRVDESQWDLAVKREQELQLLSTLARY
jgi:hypothetical protein